MEKARWLSPEEQERYTEYIAKNGTVTIDGREVPLLEALKILDKDPPKTRPILNPFPQSSFLNWFRKLLSKK